MNDSTRLIKYGVAAVLLGLYASISAWIVAGEGESYRKSIAKASTAAPDVLPDPPELPKRQVAETPSEPAEPPEPAHEPKPEPPPRKITPSSKTPPAPVDRTPKSKPADPPNPSGNAHAKAAPPSADFAFWEAPEQKKVWDLDKLSADDERRLGASLHQMILHVNAELEDGPLPRRVSEAAKPYLKNVTRKDVEYTFTVLDCPLMNVFSLPGGYIYVCRGLFDWIGEDEDYALGFALAHEIAHVDQGHAITCLRDPDVKEKFKFGTSLLFYAVMIPGGYLKAQDLEADKWAATQMFKSGKTRYETLAFLRRLEDYARSNSFENKRKNPSDKPLVPPLDNHIRAHPIPRDRLEELKTFIDRFQKI